MMMGDGMEMRKEGKIKVFVDLKKRFFSKLGKFVKRDILS